jgi:hypothetical protein
MSTETLPEKKKRVPKSADSILAGLLKLPLADQVKIQQALTKAINDEVANKQKEADWAASLLKL